MPYNEKLEEKIDALVKRWQYVAKKKMFGGVCYVLKGNMAFGILKDFLIVRMDKEQGEQSLKDKNVRSFDVMGKPMAGWVMVTETTWKRQAALEGWLGVGKKHALSLPKKKGKAQKTKRLTDYKV